MNWPTYWSFVVFAALLVVIPGPDFAVTVKNTLAGGRRRGVWSAIGIATSNIVQGVAATAGLGVLVVRAEPVFLAIKWLGIGYLLLLAAQAIRSAIRGDYRPGPDERGAGGRGALLGWREGFLSNITNPKVLVFYLAVLPQFLVPGAGVPTLLVFALTHAALGLGYSLGLVAFLHGARRVLTRRRVRRALDALTGAALLGFGARLAAEGG